MCLALLKPFFAVVPEEHLYYGFKNNDDGAGFIVSNGKRAVGRKGFFNFEEFMDAYERYNKPEYATAIHFRWATHGPKNVKNCHPFRLSDDYLAIHNGILPYPSSKERSDTYHFCRDILRPLCKNGRIEDEDVQEKIEEFIDTNKIIIMRNDGSEIILNEFFGEWEQGCWYSNESFKPNYYKVSFVGSFAKPVVMSNPGFDYDDVSIEEVDKKQLTYIETNQGITEYDMEYYSGYNYDDDYGYQYNVTPKNISSRGSSHRMTDDEFRDLEKSWAEYDSRGQYEEQGPSHASSHLKSITAEILEERAKGIVDLKTYGVKQILTEEELNANI